MSYSLHQQYLNLDSGFHVLDFRDEKGRQHLVQIAVGLEGCPACGRVHPKDSLGEIDPKVLAGEVNEAVNTSHAAMLEYAKKHGIPVK